MFHTEKLVNAEQNLKQSLRLLHFFKIQIEKQLRQFINLNDQDFYLLGPADWEIAPYSKLSFLNTHCYPD